jgi:hypothetical protein
VQYPKAVNVKATDFKLLEKLRQQFFTYYSWGVAGVSPAEGGSGKDVGFGAGGETSPLLIILNIILCIIILTLLSDILIF